MTDKQTTVERALAALDDAFSDQVKARFATLCENLAGGETLDNSVGMFAKGLRQLRDARTRAGAAVSEIFKDAP